MAENRTAAAIVNDIKTAANSSSTVGINRDSVTATGRFLLWLGFTRIAITCNKTRYLARHRVNFCPVEAEIKDFLQARLQKNRLQTRMHAL